MAKMGRPRKRDKSPFDGMSKAALLRLAVALDFEVSEKTPCSLLGSLLRLTQESPHGYSTRDLKPCHVVRVLSGGPVGRRWLVESVTEDWLGYYYLGERLHEEVSEQVTDVTHGDMVGVRFEVIGIRPLPKSKI